MTVHHLIYEIRFAIITMGDVMYYTISLIHLLPMTLQFLGNIPLFGLSESVEHDRRAQEGFIFYEAKKFFHAFMGQALKCT